MNSTSAVLYHNARLATMASGGGYDLLDQGAFVVAGGIIQWCGPADEAPQTGDVVDCREMLVTPGLLDCHTHLVYGGSRAKEFEQRLTGVSYEEIARTGGGIVSTVKATREASEDELISRALPRLDCLRAEGVTTVEIKSGYGLDVETELKMLRVARKLATLRDIDVVTTFLGAHALPPEYRDDRAGYLKLVCEESLPQAAEAGLADAVDGFCEGIAFSPDEIAKVFRVAKDLGLPLKLHAEQLSNLGGASMAAGLGALSVDHIEYLDAKGVADIARSGTVAVLLPGAFYYLGEKQVPPVEALRNASVPIALATDLNPGSSPVHSLLAAMNMACVLFRLTPEEALLGVTVNAARALGLRDRGRIAAGLLADLAFWQLERPGELAYPLGFNPLAAVMKAGAIVNGSLS